MGLKRNIFIYGFILILLIFSSCRKNEIKDPYPEARKLFVETTKLINKYSSDIRLANDSISVDSLELNFEKKLTEINFSFPPETDFKLTEQENDSIYKLLKTLKKIKEERLRTFHLIKTDTVLTI